MASNEVVDFPALTCKHCGSTRVQDETTYDDAVFADTPHYRIECSDCGRRSYWPVSDMEGKEDERAQNE